MPDAVLLLVDLASFPRRSSRARVAEIDFVRGATQSTNAFYYAVVDALKKAK